MRSITAALALASALLTIFVAPVQGATFTLTTDEEAEDPAVAIDAQGTAHVAWVRGVDPGGDQVVYCRVPRGAKACDRTETFTPDDRESFHAPLVGFMPDENRVVITAGRCCNENTWTWSTTDGGQTFSAPQVVGTLSTETATYGPGPGAITGFAPPPDGSGGVSVQVAPLAGPKETRAVRLQAPDTQVSIGRSVAFPDSTSPLATWDDLETTSYRAFDPTKGSDYFDVNNWGPVQTLPGVLESQVVSGPNGTVLLGREGSAGKRVYTARRYDPTSQTFGAPVTASDTNGDPIFKHAVQDSGGGVHLVYIRNGVVGGVEDAVMWSSSPDGKTFNPPVEVARDGGFNLRVGAGPDHGGAVVWDDNGRGPIELAELPAGGSPAGGGGNDGGGGPAPAGCKQVLQVTANVQARAQGGCWSKDGGTRWTTKADARINGIDFQTGGSGATVSVDTTKNTIETKGGVSQKAGAVVLNKGPVTWDLDGPTKFTKVDAFGIKLLGFAVTGEATVTFQKDAASIRTNISLPAPLDVATGETTMRTTMSSGLKLEGLAVKVPSTAIGPLGIKDLEVSYQGGVNTLEGRADFLLPPQKSKLLRVGFGFKDGKFAHAEIPFYNGPPLPLPLAAGDVLLNSIGFGVSVADGFRLNGQVAVAAGNFGSLKAVKLDGGFVFAIPKGSDVAQFDADGTLSVMSLPLANGHIRFRTDGIFQFDGGVSLLSGTLTGKVAGGIDVGKGDFFASGGVGACLAGVCASGEAIVSTIGAAGGVTILGTCIGGGIKWPDTPVAGCALDDFKPAQFGTRALRQAGAGGTPLTVQVPGGLEQAGFRVRGVGGVPAVSVSGPGGVEIASDPADPAAPQVKQGVALVPDAATSSVQVLVTKPQAGAFSVSGTGGAAIAGVDLATGRPLPSPEGSLAKAKKGSRARTLTWSVTGGEGEVSFVERSTASGVVHVLGKVTGTRGRLPFTVADGPGGKRTIEAVVSRGGLPRKRVTVATFTAPGPVTPARPRVKVRRRGARLAVSWSKAANARRYRVQVRMPDGRRLLADQAARTYSVPRLERDDRVRVTVRGVSSRGRLGRTATATLRPAKKARARR